MKKIMAATALAVWAASGAAGAKDSIEVTMTQISEAGVGDKIGTVRIEKTEHGVLLTPDLKGLSSGLHGFHVHQNPDCGAGQKDGKTQAGLAAGGHLDPAKAGNHQGPFHKGHLGDLPALFVDADGNATHPVLAPRIQLQQLQGHSLMIHQGGDNYSDEPEKLGGGGPRVACGVIGQK